MVLALNVISFNLWHEISDAPSVSCFMFYYPPWSHKTYLPAKRGTSKSPAFCSEWTHFEASPASSLFLNQFHFLLPALLMGQAGNWCQIKLSCCNNTESSSRVYCVPRYNPIQPPDSCQNSLNKTKLDSNHHHHDVVTETRGQWAFEQCWQYFLPPPVTILPCYQRLPLCLYWFFVSWQKLTDGGNLPDNDDEESSDVTGGSHCQGAWAGHGGSQFIIIVLTPFSLSRLKKVYELRNHRLAVEMIFWPRP